MKRASGPIDKRARARRARGGKLAVGRPSETRAGLHREREYVRVERAKGACEIRWAAGQLHSGSDFAHVVARSHQGADSRFNALWLCRYHHDAMTAPYAKGRLLVTRVVSGPVLGSMVRGFDWELVRAASKFAYRAGSYDVLAWGFIAAEARSERPRGAE